ncbi:ATP-binding protein [Tardiphaga sp.]|uniref:ATP-binding protein n=1 Tax=Tardiphaga sp. TaxID=1926292 RepID=UPI002615E0E5|nr:ATP-binding protein [Tardiphaga sp.]MDB5617843.1 histidine kinase [Tardiphaga sp.]
MTYSLRGRLLIGLVLMILGAGMATGAIIFRWAFDEAIEMQDRTLTRIAAVTLQTRFPTGKPISSGTDDKSGIVIEELGNRPDGSAGSQLLWPLKEGLHVATLDQHPWRILLRTRSDGSRIVVRQPTAARDGIARESAVYAILPFAAAMPFLMLVIALVVMQSLRPMVQLAEHLDARRSDDLKKLPLERTPRELHPFIDSINRLLDRVQVLLEQQRRFIADASHELRTPITALSLQAENLEQAELSEDGRKRLATLRDGARRTKWLVDQLLTLARYDIGHATAPVTTSLDRCAKDVVVDFLLDAVSHDVDLGFDRIEPIIVSGDSITLTTAIRNLVDNALRFTPRGGRVDISVFGNGANAVLEVRDTGPGIPPGDLDHIFEPFVRGSRPNGDGTGLGLSIVKRVAERLDGTVSLSNIDGSGTTGCRVVMTLPLAAPEASKS